MASLLQVPREILYKGEACAGRGSRGTIMHVSVRYNNRLHSNAAYQFGLRTICHIKCLGENQLAEVIWINAFPILYSLLEDFNKRVSILGIIIFL
jgi:hypothetical protein